MPFPYVTVETLKRELTLTPERVGLNDSEWQEMLGDFVETETERVERDDYAGVRYRDLPSTDDVPGIVREAVIRLSRARAHAIEQDGLSNENVGDGSSYTYRSLAEVRQEVKAELQAADLSRGEEGPDDVRVSLL